MVRDILESFRCYSYAFGDDNNIGKITEFYDVTDPEFHSERQYEIFRWLHQAQNEKDVRAWIALDDEELVEGKVNAKHRATFEGHAVLIDSRKGLTDEDADEAIRLLQSQIKTKSRETNK